MENKMRADLHFGDNLEWLKRLPSETIDLCYIDPPFNSQANYNIIVGGAQTEAFGDTWSWGIEDMRIHKVLLERGNHIGAWARGMMITLGACGMFSYLIYMAERLIEIQRVLKPTGSVYIHCDDNADYHIRLLMDALFGQDKYQNTIHWKRTTAHSTPKRFGRVTDTILFYGGSNFNLPRIPYSSDYISQQFGHEDKKGKYGTVALTGPGKSEGLSSKSWRGFDPITNGKGRNWSLPRKLCDTLGIDNNLTSQEKLELLDKAGYIYFSKSGGFPRYKQYLSNSEGTPPSDMWFDIGGTGNEDTNYPTQKPLALLERIILASSNPNDIVMDCFMGSGTTAVAAIKNGRNFMGCDITFLAVDIAMDRLKAMENPPEGHLTGHPKTLEDARALAEHDRFQYQAWALNMVGSDLPANRTSKRGKDSGIDEKQISILDDGSTYITIISVKSGIPQLKELRDLIGTVAKEHAQRGIFLMLDKPTKDMITTAASVGIGDRGETKCIILTAQDLLDGKKIPEIK